MTFSEALVLNETTRVRKVDPSLKRSKWWGIAQMKKSTSFSAKDVLGDWIAETVEENQAGTKLECQWRRDVAHGHVYPSAEYGSLPVGFGFGDLVGKKTKLTIEVLP